MGNRIIKAGPVDIHTHVVPAVFPDWRDEPRGPCMHYTSPHSATIMIADSPYRKVDSRSWNIPHRIEDMDRDGVAVQALSPMPELLSYWFSNSAAQVLCDHVNSDIAEMVSRAPSRFVGLGTIPMQNRDLALHHLERIQKVYGLQGIEIGSNINGLLLGDPCFDQIFQAAERLGLAVFVHALHPIATKDLKAPGSFTPLIGFPVDVAMAAASLIMAGTLQRYPGLRIAFSHGGGALAPVLHRLDYGWTANQSLAEGIPERPRDVAARMYFDSNVYEPAYLRYISTAMAAGNVVLGTDYPYAIMQRDPMAFVASAIEDASAREAILWVAARRFLGIEACPATP